VKKLEFGPAFFLYVTDPYAGYLMARFAFEARYSGARQYIFLIEITVRGPGIWSSSSVSIAGNDPGFPRR
jgi:hypothetical protein